ncbi:YheC/YheD family endospore coat-associated protein [Paenibacillus hexagrammi]|uniref:YheC/YheD family protein n=1 Tax=Paenibacillus hexagrammi TaxID=2908839 RepID=A0ABY3SKY3_9BACL|nr:YheC/YheD family protein [Paenibacillus sp. YPD9-1]UJF34717.1 YheC/YheD family protein [Paenibacillus sp. YPD9-1]
MQSNASPLLGIMVTELKRRLPFASSRFYEQLTLAGDALGIQVFVFSPNRINWQQRTIAGHSYAHETRSWKKDTFPLPSFIYDRCFFSGKDTYLQYRFHVRKLRETPGVRFLGYGLKGKWEVQQMLQQEAELSPYLPATAVFTDEYMLKDWLKERQQLFLKPQGGSQGKGAVHLQVVSDSDGMRSFIIHGRDSRNVPLHVRFSDWTECMSYLHGLIGRRPYLVQKYLPLHTSDGTAYDIRCFVQKNRRGLWETVGMAARAGQPGSVTSNLHGGGKALEVLSFLSGQFGENRAGVLVDTLYKLSEIIPSTLESSHGRLAELGIDFGVDTSGQIWILEVNSKPGRTIFSRTGDTKARIQSIVNPVRYAAYLWKTSSPGTVAPYRKSTVYPASMIVKTHIQG